MLIHLEVRKSFFAVRTIACLRRSFWITSGVTAPISKPTSLALAPHPLLFAEIFLRQEGRIVSGKLVFSPTLPGPDNTFFHPNSVQWLISITVAMLS